MIKSSFKAQPFLVRNTILSPNDKRSFTEYTQVIETVSKNKVFLEQLLLANPKLYDVMQKYNAGLLKKNLNLFTSIIREVIYDQLHLDYLVKLQLVFFRKVHSTS